MSLSADDAFQDPRVADFAPLTANSRIPTAFINAVRYGAPGSRHNITINGAPAQITIGVPGTPDARREADAFSQLRVALWAAVTDGIQPKLPPEISMVVWEHEGREVHVCAPGSAPTLRRARIRRRLTALSPLPLLGWLSQPLAGSVTAVGIAVAPLPPIHGPAVPPPAAVREMTGDIARPEPPYTPGTVPTAGQMPPWAVRVPSAPPAPLEFTAPDTAPPPVPAPTLTVPSPPASSGLRAPTPPVDDAPSPTANEEPTAVASPSLEPSPAPTAVPTVEGTPAPEPTITETIIVSVQPAAPTGSPRKHHRWKKRHHHPRRHR